MLGRMTRLLLLRHGQSEWNAVRRWQGRADTPLTALGRSEAARCAAELAELPAFDEVWASPLGRAEETAAIIVTRLGLNGVATDERLMEADAGDWQGLTADHIEQAYPGFLAAHRRPGTFESFESVVGRSTAALHDIANGHDGDAPILVVSHSGVLRSIVRHLGAADERIPNLGGVWVRVGSSIGDTGPGLELGDRFRPSGFAASAVDAGGEDPGEQTDQTDANRGAER